MTVAARELVATASRRELAAIVLWLLSAQDVLVGEDERGDIDALFVEKPRHVNPSDIRALLRHLSPDIRACLAERDRSHTCR